MRSSANRLWWFSSTLLAAGLGGCKPDSGGPAAGGASPSSIVPTRADETPGPPRDETPEEAPPTAPGVRVDAGSPPVGEDLDVLVPVSADFRSRPHPCRRKVKPPRDVCVLLFAGAHDVARWTTTLEKVARKTTVAEGAVGFLMDRETLERVADGVVAFEVEHATAGASDCLWRLRHRDGQFQLDLAPASDCASLAP